METTKANAKGNERGPANRYMESKENVTSSEKERNNR
jgi:hypothetical protein